MKKTYLIILLMLLMLLPCIGCTTPITGKIVDAETGQPIKGAILLVEWTKVHGFGNTYTSSEKVAEVFSDKDGIVKIPGYNDPTAQGPDVTIYKPGYVAWNSNYIFPGNKNRTDFKWKEGYVFKLEKFKEGYSYVDHGGFLGICINRSVTKHNKETFIKLYEDYELDKRVEERNLYQQRK